MKTECILIDTKKKRIVEMAHLDRTEMTLKNADRGMYPNNGRWYWKQYQPIEHVLVDADGEVVQYPREVFDPVEVDQMNEDVREELEMDVHWRPAKKFKWIVEFEVDEVWVADGFEMTGARAQKMLDCEIGLTAPGETRCQVVSGPDRRAILETQGYTGEELDHELRAVAFKNSTPAS